MDKDTLSIPATLRNLLTDFEIAATYKLTFSKKNHFERTPIHAFHLQQRDKDNFIYFLQSCEILNCLLLNLDSGII